MVGLPLVGLTPTCFHLKELLKFVTTMIKVADNLRRVILNTQEFLQKKGTWDDKIEEALSNIDAFLDHRVKYEAMGFLTVN